MKEHLLDIQGHRIAAFEYNDHIDSTPLIFIHGITATIHFWDPVQSDSIKEKHHWYSLSLPGHYPATVPKGFSPEQLTPKLVASVLSEAVRQLTGSKPAILIGHSTGGYAAYCVAHDTPDLVEKLVIVDGFSQGTWYGMLRALQVIANLPVIWSPLWRFVYALSLSSSATFRKVSLDLVYDKSAVSMFPGFDNLLNETLTQLRNHDYGALAVWFRVMPHTDIGDWLKNIAVPVHLIHGDKDSLVLPEHAEAMHNLLPNSTLTWIVGSGHVPMLERPEDFEAALMNALS